METVASFLIGLFASRKLAFSGIAGVFLVVRCFVPELQLIPVEAVLTILGFQVGGHVATDIAAIVKDANHETTASEVAFGGRRGLVAPIEPPSGV